MNRTFWAILAAPTAIVLLLIGWPVFLLTAAVFCGAGWWNATKQRDAAVELATEAQQLAARATTHAERNRALYLSLSEMHKKCSKPTVPHLRVVPSQYAGEHDRLAMSRAEWDAIVRETEGL